MEEVREDLSSEEVVGEGGPEAPPTGDQPLGEPWVKAGDIGCKWY
ncbi:MAG: hypothetical protein ACUVX8_13795 [Candidatus Zipacnadales bacterium]